MTTLDFASNSGILFAAFLVVALLGIMLVLRIIKKSKSVATPTKSAPPPNWHSLALAELLQSLGSVPEQGLSPAEVTTRQNRYGFNRLAEKPPEPAWHLLLSQFKSILILVLVIAAIVATAIGDIKDGIVILIVVMINAVLGFYQEYQAEKSLQALKKMLALQAKVRRDSQTLELSAEELVPGDIVLLEAGNKIPADGRILEAYTLEVDESSLTGESMPVSKQSQNVLSETTPLAERSNMLYMNNAVTRGRAEMVVTATGMATEIGRLAELLAQTEDESTPLQIQLDGLGKRLALIALVVVALLFATSLLRGEKLIETAFTAIALAVAAIPEGLPAVVTVTLALGMRRMAKQRAIVKRLAAVETLGCTTVICTDKTGTLTVNQMTGRAVFFKGQNYTVTGEGYGLEGAILPETQSQAPTDLKDLLLPLTLCNDSQLQDGQVLGDPMEAALLVLAGKGGLTPEQARSQLPRVAEIPFDAEHKFMATFHSDGDHIKIFIKGAPEMLLKLCHFMSDAEGQLVDLNTQDILAQNERMAMSGLRILGVAERTLPAAAFAPDADLFRFIEELTFVALVGLMDPPRPQVRDAIKLCQHAGIAVKMITGDQKVTAFAIAKELGLNGDVIEGEQLAAMDEKALAARINDIAVFARTVPEQKVRIVNALKAAGHVVAMTGDGVNDAPALKSADIGIAMGITGTDVAQEAATMILTDDNFATIVKAVKEGRGIYANMVKFIRFQLSTNIGAIFSVALAPMLGLPLPFTAIQLLWINIIMDGPPAMSLGVDPAHKDSMNEAPRDPQAQILSLKRLAVLFGYGSVMTAGTLGVLYSNMNQGAAYASSLAFTTFVLFQVFNVFNARSEKGTAFNRQFFSNKLLWLSLSGVILMQITIIEWAPAQNVFHTSALTLNDWGLATMLAATVLVLEEARKLVMRGLGLV